jgi:hypothetical protein
VNCSLRRRAFPLVLVMGWFESYEPPYRGKPLAVFSLADLADEKGGDEEEEL